VPAHGVKVAIGIVSIAIGMGAVAWRGLARQRQLVGNRKSSMTIPTLVLTSLIGGLVMLVAVLSFMQLCTEQGFRSAVQVGGFVVGVLALLSAKGIARRTSARAQLLIAVVAAVAIVFAAAVVRIDSDSPRFRSGLFGTLALLAALVLGNALLDATMAKRRIAIREQDLGGRWLAFGGVTLAVVGLGVRLLYSNAPIRASILWWILITLAGAYVLARTRYGNWIFAVGGNKDAARAVGVPVEKVKVGLFMMVSLVGCLVGMIVALRYTSVTSGQGVGQEFEYIIAAVVGGCLLTGGYGSVIGASFGAMISAMLKTGIPGSQWNTDNKYIFLGVVLFLAVLVNQKVRKKAEEAR
jgi:simple sugar transport system permease protein